MGKNVAVDIAEKLCQSVGEGLEGRKISGFNGVKNAVKAALEEALSRILTPKQSMDVLREVKATKAKGRAYVVVFVGVNGVGKSTSLSKICFWLKSQGLKVLLAACDTFRSGAVEQIKTHAARLDVPVYEKVPPPPIHQPRWACFVRMIAVFFVCLRARRRVYDPVSNAAAGVQQGCSEHCP